MICFKLAKAGYYGGNPSNIAEERVDLVMKIVAYESFMNNHEEQMYLLNNEK